jgi:hypothetical protein
VNHPEESIQHSEHGESLKSGTKLSYLENKNIRKLLVIKQETILQVANSRIPFSFSINLVQNNFRNSELRKSHKSVNE